MTTASCLHVLEPTLAGSRILNAPSLVFALVLYPLDPLPSVAGNRLRRRRLAEHQVSDESSDRDGKHNPTVVCHEEQPIVISLIRYQI
jgi:hypothetical protein